MNSFGSSLNWTLYEKRCRSAEQGHTACPLPQQLCWQMHKPGWLNSVSRCVLILLSLLPGFLLLPSANPVSKTICIINNSNRLHCGWGGGTGYLHCLLSSNLLGEISQHHTCRDTDLVWRQVGSPVCVPVLGAAVPVLHCRCPDPPEMS